MKEKRLELLEQLVKEVTDYGYNSEYGDYDTWANGVRPIIEKGLHQVLSEERKRLREEIEKIYSISDVDNDTCDNFKQKVLDLVSSPPSKIINNI